MTRFAVLFAIAFALSGCLDGTNPFMEEDEATDTTTTTNTSTTTADPEPTEETPNDDGEPIVSDVTELPGTANPSSTTAIFRREPRSTDAVSVGNGYAEGFVYDTFAVDNIAFDGDNPYTAVTRTDGTTKIGFGPFSVFEAVQLQPTHSPLQQLINSEIIVRSIQSGHLVIPR